MLINRIINLTVIAEPAPNQIPAQKQPLAPDWKQINVTNVAHTLLLASIFSIAALAQNATTPQPSQEPSPANALTAEPQTSKPQAEDTTPTAPVQPQKTQPARPGSLAAQSWQLIHDGTSETHTLKRASAVRVLALLKGQPRGITLATRALGDEKYQVRVAAALALGELHATSAIPKLKEALSDKEPVVVLAAAHSLAQMKDSEAYEFYYEIVTGERRGNKGLVAGELDTLKDPKKMAMLGFEEGIGFVPFAGIGYTAIRTVMKDDSSPVRAAAAKILAEDRNPSAAKALIYAAIEDKNELVRAAALEALAHRGDPSVIDQIAPALSDPKDTVKYTAAAAILRLSQIKEHRSKNPSIPPSTAQTMKHKVS